MKMNPANSFYTPEELEHLGLMAYGKNVLISRKASIYGAEDISLGDNVRIDDFCILSGHLKLGSNIHISAYCALYGALGIEMQDYTGLSAGTILYSAMDDFSGNYLIGPVHPKELTNVSGGKIVMESYSQIGARSVVFPNVTIREGAVAGALSLIKEDMEPWSIYAGIPAKKIKERDKQLLNRIEEFHADR